MSTKCNEETYVNLGKLILKLKKSFSFITDVFVGTIEDVPVAAVEITSGSLLATKKRYLSVFQLWNTKNYAPDSVMRSPAITRVLLELASIEDSNDGKVRFGIYYLGNIYSLKDIVDNGSLKRLTVPNLKRIVYAVSK